MVGLFFQILPLNQNQNLRQNRKPNQNLNQKLSQNLNQKQSQNQNQNLSPRVNQKQNQTLLPVNILIYMMVVADRKHVLASLTNVLVREVVSCWLPGERITMNLIGNCSAHLAREAM